MPKAAYEAAAPLEAFLGQLGGLGLQRRVNICVGCFAAIGNRFVEQAGQSPQLLFAFLDEAQSFTHDFAGGTVTAVLHDVGYKGFPAVTNGNVYVTPPIALQHATITILAQLLTLRRHLKCERSILFSRDLPDVAFLSGDRLGQPKKKRSHPIRRNAGIAENEGVRPPYLPSTSTVHGLTITKPTPSKFETFRVASAAPRERAIEALRVELTNRATGLAPLSCN